REIEQFLDALAKTPNDIAIDVQSVPREARLKRFEVVPVRLRLRQAVDDVEPEPERLADVAYRASRPIANDRGRERRTVSAVLVENVLNDLFAALMLEIDIDVGRLVALLADEPLEQHV